MFAKLLGAGALAALIAVSPANAQDGEPITFGFLGPFTGQFAANGQRFEEAAKLFVEQTNAAGGIAGRPLVIEFEDDRGDPLQAANIAQRFVSNDDIVAAIGSFTSTASMAAGEIFANAKMPQVSPTSSHPDYTKISEYQFRMPNTQDIVAGLNAELIMEKLGAESVAIAYFQDDWGIFVGDATSAEVKERGGDVVLLEAMTPQARDFRSMITKIRALQPDAIFLASHYQVSSIFLQQLRQAGLDIPVGGADSLYNPELINLAGDAVEDFITSAYFFPDDPSKAAFTEAYEAKYGRKPDQWSAFAYDAVAITAEAAKVLLEAGEELTRENMRNAIDDLPPFDGVTGTTDFVNGTPRKPMTLLQVRDGEYKLLESDS
ncbi:MAG: ABC transporter substrate-binding protein [Pseudomonadota bacterium]